jgi:hypothetical protein
VNSVTISKGGELDVVGVGLGTVKLGAGRKCWIKKKKKTVGFFTVQPSRWLRENVLSLNFLFLIKRVETANSSKQLEKDLTFFTQNISIYPEKTHLMS